MCTYVCPSSWCSSPVRLPQIGRTAQTRAQVETKRSHPSIPSLRSWPAPASRHKLLPVPPQPKPSGGRLSVRHLLLLRLLMQMAICLPLVLLVAFCSISPLSPRPLPSAHPLVLFCQFFTQFAPVASWAITLGSSFNSNGHPLLIPCPCPPLSENPERGRLLIGDNAMSLATSCVFSLSR
jgi:hypothetical protein